MKIIFKNQILIQFFFFFFFLFFPNIFSPASESSTSKNTQKTHKHKSIANNGAALPEKRPVAWTRPRLNDLLTSLTAGMIQQLVNLLILRSITLQGYIWVYERYALVQLDPLSLWTWVLGLIFVDFGYYWFHRASHEVNLFWSGHVVHHSSEDYNQSTALRQSVLQSYFGWVFYLPFALVLPPPMFVAHKHFNLLFQYWIHTETIGKLGPIEYLFNTPSHHRVHHGSNPYCIDSNYGLLLFLHSPSSSCNLSSPSIFFSCRRHLDHL